MTFKNLGTFIPYVPEPGSVHDFMGHADVLFCKNGTGQDWYALQKTLPKEGAYYIATDATGLVTMADDDPSMLFPAGFTLYQLPVDGLDPATLLGKRFDLGTGGFVDVPAPAVRETTMFRARFVMKHTTWGSGTLWDEVQAAITALPDPIIKALATEALDHGNTFSADSPLVQQLTASVGVSPAQLQGLIDQANVLPA